MVLRRPTPSDTQREINMTIEFSSDDNGEDGLEGRVDRSGGIYALPVIGPGARKTRQFFDDMAPTEDDSLGVKIGKNTLRAGAVAGSTAAGFAVAAVLVL
jgi:hypothetical protein